MSRQSCSYEFKSVVLRVYVDARVTPFATFALTLGDVLGTSNINEIEALVKYFATAALTLAILALSYPILYVAIMRQNPMPFFRAIAPAMLTASTTSSR